MTERPVLVDTQLLVLLVVGATKPSLIAKHRRTRSSYTQIDYGLLLDLLGHDPRIVFCPHVASEVSNLVAQHGEPDRTSLMAVLKALLNNAAESALSSASAMDQPEYLPLGLADAAQIALCDPPLAAVLLTDDEPLFRAATARGRAALYFSDEKLQRRRFLA